MKKTFLIIAFLAVSTVLLTSVFYEMYWLFLIIVCICIIIPITFVKSAIPYLFAFFFPLSQMIPLGDKSSKLALYPEYVLIPLVSQFIFFFFYYQSNKKNSVAIILLPLIIFLLIAFFSLLLSGLNLGFEKIFQGIGAWIMFTVSFMSLFVFVYLFEKKNLQNLVFLFLLSSFTISIVGIIEYIFLHNTVTEGNSYRISSLFGSFLRSERQGNPNVLGTFLTVSILLSISVRQLYYGIKKNILLSGAFINLFALFLTSSRSGLVALVIGIIYIGSVLERRLLFVIPAIFLFSVGTFILNPRWLDRLTSIWIVLSDSSVFKYFTSINLRHLDWNYVNYFGLGGYSVDVVSGASRLAAWLVGVETFLRFPFLGVGLRMNYFYSGFETAENFFLDILVMTGILGFICFIWFFYKIRFIIKDILRRTTDKFSRNYTYAYISMMIVFVVVSLTGSVFFNFKLMMMLSFLTSLLWHVHKHTIQETE
ncbi:MAG: O-antigen ligase family protein [Bacteroidota bacterium]